MKLASSIQRKQRAEAEQQARRQKEKQKQRGGGGLFDADRLVEQIGNPDFSRLLMAAALAASIPETINKAAHANQWATEVLLYCLMDRDREIREQQLLLIAQKMGSDSEARVRGLLEAEPELAREQRLPLLEISIPELKRRPQDHVSRVLATVKALSDVDGKIDIFEYLMAEIITQHLWESSSPQSVRLSGKKALKQVQEKALDVIAILALNGQEQDQAVDNAYRAGAQLLGAGPEVPMPDVGNWCKTLDEALPVLDQLKPLDKQKLVSALIATVMSDNSLAVAEMELLRVICLVIHVPLPMISGGAI